MVVMSRFEEVISRSPDGPEIDAFSRQRISNPFTLFDSKQITDQHESLLWDDQEVTGSGTSSTYDQDRASTDLDVSLNTAGKRIRQTKQRFNYQPGKSQLLFITFLMDKTGGGSGITRHVGCLDDDNGIFLKDNEGTYQVGLRSNATGSPVDEVINQSSWNLDTMDGNGTSGVTLDFSKTQIFIIDYEWLGVGRVRVGFVIDGLVIYCHEFLNTNSKSVVYMSSPNLPIRYELENDGTGAASDLECICCTVISEGGFEPNGIIRSSGTGRLKIDANTSGTFYALLGIRLKSTCLGGSVFLEKMESVIDSNDRAYWQLLLNPTVAGTFNYSNVTNSIVQEAIGDTTNDPSTNTVTGGILIDQGYISQESSEASVPLKNALKLGAAIDGTQDEIVLCVTPFEGDANLDIAGGLTWREVI
jgi:hypothetical protein